MKRKFILFQFIVVAIATLNASTQWNLQGKTYQVDTLSHVYVGPGTTQTGLSLSGPSLLRIFYTTTDLADPYVEIRAIKGQDKVLSVEYVSSMAESRSKNGVNYFSGVNADFFSTVTPMFPIGSVLVDGEPYYTNNGDSWQAFGITDNKIPYLGTSVTNATVKTESKGTATITSVNTSRYENYLTLYSSRFGTSTQTNIYGTEVQLIPVDGAVLKTGVPAKMRVVAAPVSSVGNMTIPSGGYVLSGNGNKVAFVQSLSVNEVIEITPSVSFNGVNAGAINQIVGGQPMILSNNEVLNTEGVIDHLVGLHPRTAVGFSANKKNLVMLVVDGRSSISAGVTSKMLADIMKNAGCTEAMNFDGGGSTEMYSRTFGIVNRPSEGKERAVSDGLFVATSVPQDNNIAIIRFNDHSKLLPKYGYFEPTIYGYNKYGVLIDTNVKGVTFSAPTALGEVVNGGTALFCTGDGTHAFTATYNGLEAKIPVTVSKGKMEFRLSSAIEDGYTGYVAEVTSTIGENKYLLDNRAMTWWSEDASIATVEPVTGKIKGIANGKTKIHAKVDNEESVLEIIVQKPVNFFTAIDSPFDALTWKASQVGGKVINFLPLENGFSYSYKGESGRSPSLKFTKEVVLWSLPDSIHIRINPQGAPVQSVTFSVKNAQGVVVNEKITTSLAANSMNTVSLATKDWCDALDRANYPITFNSMTFGMGASTVGTEYTILVPGLETVYKTLDPSGVDEIIAIKDEINIFPNPVTSGETITIKGLKANEAVRIYNNSGMLIRSFVSTENQMTFSTAGLDLGVYYVSHQGKAEKLIVK